MRHPRALPRPAGLLRLATAALLLAAVAAPALAQRTAASQAAVDDAVNYRLTMANIERLVPLAKSLNAIQGDADVRAYMTAQKPIFKKRIDELEARGEMNDGTGLLLLYEMLDGQPKIHRAFAAAGLTPRDYALTSLHLGANWMAVGMERQFKKSGTAPAGIPGLNWTLVHQNQARIEQIMTELAKYPADFGDDEKSDEG